MQNFQQEWDADFDSQSIVDNSNPPSMVTPSATPPHSNIVHGSIIVIDNILLYSTNIYTLIRYFSCVDRILIRYRLSFKLSKCKFFNPRVEYLGYDLTSRGNYPAQSKFDLLKEWTLPDHGTPLLSFFGLCTFYAGFSPWFEINLKPLRKFQRLHHRKAISTADWKPSLIRLFDKCKKS